MTREEKQKAIDALKISVPIKALTQEEFNDYIQTINQIIDWLEQEPSGDAINKQEVLDLFNKSDEYSWEMSLLRKKIEKNATRHTTAENGAVDR